MLVRSAAPRNGNLAHSVLIAANWRLLFSVGFYGLAFLFYAAAVSRLPLNIADPITTAAGIIVVGLSSMFVVGERVPVGVAVRYGLLLAGVPMAISAGR